jgi:hypothetical protein
MEILGTILLGLGGLIGLVGALWWLGVCFQSSPLWGTLSLVTFPIGNIVWLLFHPKKGWKPALATFVGTILLGGAYLCFTRSMADQPNMAKARATFAHSQDGIFNPYNPFQPGPVPKKH